MANFHLNEQFKNAYAFLRLDKKIKSQQDVADATGVTKSFINKILKGEKQLSPAVAKSFEDFYSIRLSEYDAPKYPKGKPVRLRDFQRDMYTFMTVLKEGNDLLLKHAEKNDLLSKEVERLNREILELKIIKKR